ncbi:class I SAM-dependent methyltransferase [Martelella soudanensis]|uniref:class I SAM-dependent methyltransferase n=1 Tax=unclassified Martelella TaxID=2629616 RepID=UPI001FEE7E3E|nr:MULTISPECIES: 50S ribosomal protein L11 methyltransferase [unclassified Martelella]
MFRDIVETRLPATPVPGLSSLRLHLANEKSGLGRLLSALGSGSSPYWAHVWAGGLALAHHIEAEPDFVRGRTVIDYGTGSGLVAIAAAKAGAKEVFACDIDPLALEASSINADLNGVAIVPRLIELGRNGSVLSENLKATAYGLSAQPPNLLAPEGRDVAKATVRGESISANALTNEYAASPSLPLSGHLSRRRERVLGASPDAQCNSAAANPEPTVVLAGDVFYDPTTAGRTLANLRALAEAGANILIGDPFRAHLPERQLSLIARYEVADFASAGKTVAAGVFRPRQAWTACS